jgi:lipopolysaccharide heptosyltransferase II
MKATHPRPSSSFDRAMIDLVHTRDFDAAVIFTVFSQNPLPAALLCYLAEIPLRLAHCRENPYQLLTTWVRETEPDQGIRHEVRRQLDLTSTIGAHTPDETIRLQVPSSAHRAAQSMLKESLDPRAPWIAIHPGATAPSRRYPASQFAEAARALIDRGIQVLFLGGADDHDFVQSVQALVGRASSTLDGRLDLMALAAVLQAAPVLICNNSGPAHLAAGVGTPVVDLYALTNPQHHPWGVPSRVLFFDVHCRNCFASECPQGHHACLERVPPSDVVIAALELLSERAARPG